MSTQNQSIKFLLERFNGQILIPFAAGVSCLGINQQTARNQLSQHKFPIPSFLIGNRRYFHIQDLSDYADNTREKSLAISEARND